MCHSVSKTSNKHQTVAKTRRGLFREAGFPRVMEQMSEGVVRNSIGMLSVQGYPLVNLSL